jgi:hypothetical protein
VLAALSIVIARSYPAGRLLEVAIACTEAITPESFLDHLHLLSMDFCGQPLACLARLSTILAAWHGLRASLSSCCLMPASTIEASSTFEPAVLALARRRRADGAVWRCILLDVIITARELRRCISATFTLLGVRLAICVQLHFLIKSVNKF